MGGNPPPENNVKDSRATLPLYLHSTHGTRFPAGTQTPFERLISRRWTDPRWTLKRFHYLHTYSKIPPFEPPLGPRGRSRRLARAHFKFAEFFVSETTGLLASRTEAVIPGGHFYPVLAWKQGPVTQIFKAFRKF